MASADKADKPEPGLNEATFKGLEWRGIGPAFMSGRIADIEVDPRRRSTWYVAVGSGGVWKTDNRGTTWQPLFDDQASYSIGDIAIDPNNASTIWVGTGENVSGRHVGYGDGVYKSLDGGKTWTNMGLKRTEHIGMIAVDPRDSRRVFVAAQGPLWSGGGERGLFYSGDGGANWTNVLSGNEYTGVTEVHMDPRNPDVMFAATHQRLRTVAALMDGGPGSGIHKTTDGGRTWRRLTAGLPEENMGKIGLAVSPADPDVVYATIELAQRKVAFYRSTDGGETWEMRSEYQSDSTGPHYYIELFASPHHVDHVYEMDNQLRFTNDGGRTLQRLRHESKHVDHHALVFDPDDPDYVMVGTDGGIYETFDGGQAWRYVSNLPVTQFYKVAVDYDEPFYNVYGGTQDNSTQGGPSRTDNLVGIQNSDWFITVFADGHQTAVDPTNPDIVYSEWQQGNLVRYDRKNGQIVYIQPQPGAGEPGERFNWDAPILISPHDPARLYFASQRLWRSDDRGDSWRPVSGDLSHGIDRFKEPMMGLVWAWESPWDTSAMSKFGSITSVSESPLVEGLLYVGTDDGRIHVSPDGGENWREISKLPGVEDGYFVNDIKADLHDPDTVYVLVDQHKTGDFAPYVFKSSNRGGLWRSISSDLPARHLAWRLVQDHVKPDLLFIGTEFGVFFSVDAGGHWVKLAGGAPTIPFRDLAIQRRENDLVGASFGRGIFILDDYSTLREVSEPQLQGGATLFPVRDAHWYIPQRPLGDRKTGGVDSLGDAHFVAPNPPFGAVMTYYLAEDLLNAADTRRKRDREANEAGKDAPYPGFEALQREAAEDAAAIVVTIRDREGAAVRRFEGPAEAGFHRVAWDLRYAEPAPWMAEVPEGTIQPPGPLAEPGRYTAEIARRVDAVETPLAEPRSFDVVPMHEATLEGAAPADMVAFVRELDALMRAASAAEETIKAALTETAAIKETLLRSTAPAELRTETHAIEQRLRSLQAALVEDPVRDRANTPGLLPVKRRLQVALLGTVYSTYGPTPTHRRSLEIAREKFAGIRAGLDQAQDSDLPALRAKLDAAGVPWTPGRGVPGDS